MKHFVIILCICSVLASSVQCKVSKSWNNYLQVMSVLTVASVSLWAAYKLKITRAEVTRYNKEYIELRLWITKPDRYTNAVNGEYCLHKLPRNTKVKIQAYEFLSNEYRPFAIHFERNLCSFMALEYKTMIYPDFVRFGAHMPEPRCPVKPGNCSFANTAPNIDNYPPGLPFRNWLLTIEFWHGPVEVLLMKIFGTLDRDAVIREQYS